MKQDENKAIIIEKRVECIIGIIFLIVPLIAVFCFLLNWFGCDWDFVQLYNLGGEWTYHFDQGGSVSPTPLFIGLMALSGAYLIKDKLRYFFIKGDDKNNQ